MTAPITLFDRVGRAQFLRTAAKAASVHLGVAPPEIRDAEDRIEVTAALRSAPTTHAQWDIPAFPLPPGPVLAADGQPLVPDEIAQVLGIVPAGTLPAPKSLSSIAHANSLRHPRFAVLSKLYGRPDDGRGEVVQPHSEYALANASVLGLYQADSSMPAPLSTFRTDGYGRPVKTAGVITLEQGNRRAAADPMLARLGNRDDVGFHLGANSFGFPGGPLNVVPGDDHLNNNAYRIFEHAIEAQARRLLNRSRSSPIFPKQVVSAEFQAYYLPENRRFRPDLFRVSFWTAKLRFPLTPIGDKESAIFFNGKRVVALKPRRKAHNKRLKAAHSLPI